MASGCKIFGLLMYKNLLVRKRHWRLTIFLQALVPIALFALLQAMRDFSVNPPIVYNESTHYEIQTREYLVKHKIDNSINQVYYVPKNSYTEKLMEETTRKCLMLLPESEHCLISDTI